MKTLALAILVPLMMLTAPVRAVDATGSCDIVFAATSTVHNFEGTVAADPFAVTASPDGALSMTIDVAVLKMDTDSKKRDKDMFKMFDQPKFPTIKGVVKNASMASAHPGEGKDGKMKMDLTIRDVTQTIEADIRNWSQTGSHVEFDMEFPVSLTASKLTAPKVLFIKVGDIVKVKAHFKLPLSAESVK